MFQIIENFCTRKALGLDQISNKVFKANAYKISSYLKQIFNNLLILNDYLLDFKELAIVILCKYRKNQDYISSNSNWLITILNILGTIMEAILVTRVSYITIIYNILLKTHFWGQSRLYIKTAIYNIFEKIYVA